jgi:hypothetical protein
MMAVLAGEESCLRRIVNGLVTRREVLREKQAYKESVRGDETPLAYEVATY